MKKKKYKNSGYSEGGASAIKPSLKTWQPQHFSAKSDIEENIDVLRRRAHDLAINSAVGSAIIQTLTNGVLGRSLKVYPAPEIEDAESWSRNVQLQFNKWAMSLDADFSRRNNFYELARIAFQSYLIDGDCFCLFQRNLRSRGSTLSLQLLEAQRVSNPQSGGSYVSNVEMWQPGGRRIINGVEVDKFGRQIAIHVCNKIWNEPTTQPELKWQRVKIFGENGTRNLLHICFDTRPEMYRGTPLLSPVIESLKQVARFTEATLSSAIIKSFFSLFFIQQQTSLDLNQILPDEELDLREYRLGSGTLSSLPRGVDVKSIESGTVMQSFADFTNFFIKKITAAVGLPAEIVLKSFDSSYSASRGALIQAEETFKERRQAFENDFLQPVYEMWLAEMIASGKIIAPGFFEDEFKRYCYSHAEWRREVVPALDPNKDANAAAKRIEAGISTREIEAVKIGNDWAAIKNEVIN